ncbi:unnamed protein product [Notodromas monacha]|uniref:Uncharacterized protein n=1 Tax=Notodromas monacha TaxID=399045 RepID=A0A7R9GAW0_9CRUS|nr:unnamed protein product [Notodromas monacha]CAG0915670.1 unnamed protein product [Notodromas monacha]
MKGYAKMFRVALTLAMLIIRCEARTSSAPKQLEKMTSDPLVYEPVVVEIMPKSIASNHEDFIIFLKNFLARWSSVVTRFANVIMKEFLILAPPEMHHLASKTTSAPFAEADIRIESAAPGDAGMPNTLRSLGCEHPGLFIHVPVSSVFLASGDVFGNNASAQQDDAMLEAWAQYRWGTFSTRTCPIFGDKAAPKHLRESSLAEPDFDREMLNDETKLELGISAHEQHCGGKSEVDVIKKHKDIRHRESMTMSTQKINFRILRPSEVIPAFLIVIPAALFKAKKRKNSESAHLAKVKFSRIPDFLRHLRESSLAEPDFDREMLNDETKLELGISAHEQHCGGKSEVDVIKKHKDIRLRESMTMSTQKINFRILRPSEVIPAFLIVIPAALFKAKKRKNSESRADELNGEAILYLFAITNHNHVLMKSMEQIFNHATKSKHKALFPIALHHDALRTMEEVANAFQTKAFYAPLDMGPVLVTSVLQETLYQVAASGNFKHFPVMLDTRLLPWNISMNQNNYHIERNDRGYDMIVSAFQPPDDNLSKVKGFSQQESGSDGSEHSSEDTFLSSDPKFSIPGDYRPKFQDSLSQNNTGMDWTHVVLIRTISKEGSWDLGVQRRSAASFIVTAFIPKDQEIEILPDLLKEKDPAGKMASVSVTTLVRKGSSPVLGAIVSCVVIREDEFDGDASRVVEEVLLADAGDAGDIGANDGIYTAKLPVLETPGFHLLFIRVRGIENITHVIRGINSQGSGGFPFVSGCDSPEGTWEKVMLPGFSRFKFLDYVKLTKEDIDAWGANFTEKREKNKVEQIKVSNAQNSRTVVIEWEFQRSLNPNFELHCQKASDDGTKGFKRLDDFGKFEIFSEKDSATSRATLSFTASPVGTEPSNSENHFCGIISRSSEGRPRTISKLFQVPALVDPTIEKEASVFENDEKNATSIPDCKSCEPVIVMTPCAASESFNSTNHQKMAPDTEEITLTISSPSHDRSADVSPEENEGDDSPVKLIVEESTPRLEHSDGKKSKFLVPVHHESVHRRHVHPGAVEPAEENDGHEHDYPLKMSDKDDVTDQRSSDLEAILIAFASSSLLLLSLVVCGFYLTERFRCHVTKTNAHHGGAKADPSEPHHA